MRIGSVSGIAGRGDSSLIRPVPDAETLPKKNNISRFFRVYTNKVKVIENFRLSSGIFDRSDFYF